MIDALIEVFLTGVFVLGTFFGPVIVYEVWQSVQSHP